MTDKILKEKGGPLCIQYLTQFFNAILLHGYPDNPHLQARETPIPSILLPTQ
jgi:hypothetical protein